MDDIFQFVLHQQTKIFPLVKTSDIIVEMIRCYENKAAEDS